MEAMAQLMMKQSVSVLDSDATTQGDMASEIRLRALALEEKRIELCEDEFNVTSSLTSVTLTLSDHNTESTSSYIIFA